MSRTPGSAASMESTSSRAAASVAAASSSGRRQGRRRAPCTGEGSRGGVGREKGREREGEVKVEDNKFGGFFLHIFMPRGAISRGMDLSGTT